MVIATSAQEAEVDSKGAGPTGLATRIAQWTTGVNRFETPIRGLILHRWETPTEPTSYNLPPNLCLIGQGKKRVLLGEETYVYDANSFLLTSVDLPLIGEVLEASTEKPYLGLSLELDLRMLAQVILSLEVPASRPSGDCHALAVSVVSPSILDAINRLIDLLDRPEDIPALAPLILQEISYRLLAGEQGPRLRQLASVESRSHQIARAIDWLKENFDKPLRIGELADRAGLSTSAFHSKFRAMTAMSPLQYQKRIRLNEARQLMLTEHMDASSAAFEVGYESPSQFSREYNRMFGAPPMRDIKNFMNMSTA